MQNTTKQSKAIIFVIYEQKIYVMKFETYVSIDETIMKLLSEH